MKATLKVRKVQILQGCGCDEILLYLEGPSPYPLCGYEGMAKIMTACGHGPEYCTNVLGIGVFEVIKV